MDKSKEMALLAQQALEEKKGQDIKVIDIRDISVIADHFVISHGTNPSQIEALIDEVKSELAKNGYEPLRIEGRGSTGWVLLDYGDLIVHIFSEENRNYYNLERLWRDGKLIGIENLDI